MIYIFFLIYVLHQCCQALGLPAPVSVKMESHNFEHILRWTPGPGTPPNTTYKIKYSCPGVRPQCKSGWEKTTLTMLNLTTNLTSVRMQYKLQVRALSRGQQSPWSLPHTFIPIRQTVLGPPEVSVSGCGDCLRLNISFPRGRAPQSILEIYKEFEFSIFWKRHGESQSQKETTMLSQREINHLHRGVKYCVQVQPKNTYNKNILPSNWTCAFTSPIPKTPIPAVLASVSVSLILVGGALLALVYTGFLCKTKTSLPRTLTSLLRWYPLIVDDTVLDPVSLVSELGGNGAKAHQQRDGGASDEDEEEEEVEGEDKGYETRSMGAGLSSASERSSATPLTSHISTPEDSGNCSTCRSVAEEMGDPLSAERLGQRERETEGAWTSKGVEEEEDQQEEEQGSCGDINLLSVTLAAQEEEEEEEEEDSWVGDPSSVGNAEERRPLLSMETGKRDEEREGLFEIGGLQIDTACTLNQSEHGQTGSCYLTTQSEQRPTSTHYLRNQSEHGQTDSSYLPNQSEQRQASTLYLRNQTDCDQTGPHYVPNQSTHRQTYSHDLLNKPEHKWTATSYLSTQPEQRLTASSYLQTHSHTTQTDTNHTLERSEEEEEEEREDDDDDSSGYMRR